ncbi:MAG: LysR family transcriptional regulator [Gemmataceae bacterium]
MHQLRYFATVAELGNFTQAAAACCVSQPSLSQAVAKLERELGVTLIERLPRGLRLTEAGRRFRERAVQILRLADEASACAADDGDAGRLVLGAIPTVAPYLLPPVLSRFAAECPRARVELIEEPTPSLLERLAGGEVDLAVLSLPVRGEHLVTEPLLTEELLALLPAGHRLAAKARLTVADLADEPFALLHAAHCLSAAALSFCSRHAVAPLVTARIHQLATVQELVRLGRGVSLVPAMAASADGHPGRAYRRLAGDRPARTVALAYNELRYRSRLWERMAAALREVAVAPPSPDS